MSAVRLGNVGESGQPLDKVVLFAATGLMLFGLVMVTSASSEVAARNYGHPLYLALKHGVFMAAGCAGFLVLRGTASAPGLLVLRGTAGSTVALGIAIGSLVSGELRA